MRVRYGNISASCNSCGSQHFEFLTPADPVKAESVLACLRCRATTIHEHLLTQIGDEAMRQADRAMIVMKARHRQHQQHIDQLRRYGANEEDEDAAPLGFASRTVSHAGSVAA